LQKVTFSTVRSDDLKRAGVIRKRLVFVPVKVTELAKALPTNAEAEISDLHSRIKKIYARVNMDVCFSFAFGGLIEYLLVV
jgi:methionyl-tRNA formyltransferase